MRIKYLLAAAFLVMAAGAAKAQTVSLTPSDPQASTFGCYTAPVVNATVAAGTCSILVPAGQYAYFNYLQVGACGNQTANIVNDAQLAFTSTNLGGWQQQFSFYQGAAVTGTGDTPACVFVGGPRVHPLKSAQGPVTITIVPPAQQANSSYPINAEYYFAQ